jgi:hypothetical protein
VQGVFEEGKAHAKSGEFGEAKAYILAKLMWDPYADVEYLLDDFLQGYYGKDSASYVKEYIDIVTNKTLNTNQHLYTFQWHYEGMYFTPKERKHLDSLWNAAEENAGSDQQLEHIKRSRLSFRHYKANQLLDEFSPLNFNRLKENEKLYNDTVNMGINYLTIGGPISQTPNFWLRPVEWSN